VDLKAGYTYLIFQTGIEASAAVGVTLNMINYHGTELPERGEELHIEGRSMTFALCLAAGVGGGGYLLLQAFRAGFYWTRARRQSRPLSRGGGDGVAAHRTLGFPIRSRR